MAGVETWMTCVHFLYLMFNQCRNGLRSKIYFVGTVKYHIHIWTAILLMTFQWSYNVGEGAWLVMMWTSWRKYEGIEGLYEVEEAHLIVWGSLMQYIMDDLYEVSSSNLSMYLYMSALGSMMLYGARFMALYSCMWLCAASCALCVPYMALAHISKLSLASFYSIQPTCTMWTTSPS